MEKEFQILGTIKRVEAPPFLLTRILNAIQNQQKELVHKKWAWAAAAFLILVFALNIATIHINQKNQKFDLAEIFEIKTQNNFYNE